MGAPGRPRRAAKGRAEDNQRLGWGRKKHAGWVNLRAWGWGGVDASTLGSSAAGPQPRGPRACPPTPVSPPRLGSFSKSFSYSLGLSASPSFGGFPRHLSHSCLQLARASPTLSGGLAVWVSPEISPRALPRVHARVRAPSLPVYVCTFVFFSPESLISALSLYLVCACACARARYWFSVTVSPLSFTLGSVPISQTLASTCTLSVLCQSVLLSPPFLLLPSRRPTRGQLLRLSF